MVQIVHCTYNYFILNIVKMAIVMVLGSVEDERANPSLGGTTSLTTPRND
jgi:hypothetical protein